MLSVDDGRLLLGSLSAVIGRDVSLDSYLPDWLEEGIESSLRDSEDDAPQAPIAVQSISSTSPRVIASSSRNTPVVLTPTGSSPSGSYVRQNGKGDWNDLDKFYADAESTEEEDEEDESEEEEDEEGAESGEEVEEDESEGDGEEPGEEPETDSADEDADEKAHILHHAR